MRQHAKTRDFIADLTIKNRNAGMGAPSGIGAGRGAKANPSDFSYSGFKNKNYDLLAQSIQDSIRFDFIKKDILRF